MNEIKISWLDRKVAPIREYQTGLEMCLTSGTNKAGQTFQATEFVICKDYLHDAIAASVWGKKYTCLYFTYDPSTDPEIYKERTRIVIGDTTDKDLATKIPALLEFLNQFEERIHLLPSTAFQCVPPPNRFKDTGCFMIEGSSRWMLAPPMISLYSLLIRVGLRHVLGSNFDETVDQVVMNKLEPLPRGTVGCNDNAYLKAALPGIERILRLGYARVFHRDIKDNYPSVDINYMHHKTGIVSYANKLCEMHFPHWFRFDKLKKRVVKKADAA